MTKFGIEEDDLQNIKAIFESEKQISEVILFGSRAKGNFSNGSDIDLALKGENLTLNNLLNLATALDELLLPYKFDLVIFSRIEESKLTEHIEKIGVILFNREKE